MPGRVADKDRVSQSSSKDEESVQSKSSESSSETSSMSPQPEKRKAPTTMTNSAKRTKSSTRQRSNSRTSTDSSDTNGEDKEEAESISAAPDVDESEVEETASQTLVGGNGQNQSISREELRVYQPPDGFERSTAISRNNEALSQLLSSSNLASKQLWHITAPASVPITSISEIASKAATSEDGIITHKGVSYRFAPDLSASGMSSELLTSNDAGRSYKAVSASFTQVLQLQQVVSDTPGFNGDSRHGSSTQRSMVKEVRHQPNGLRTRFWPLGFEEPQRTT